MCMLLTETKVLILKILDEVLKEGQPFTGYDVWKRCSDHKETRPVPHDPHATGKEVSSFVREQFNHGEMPGWASTQVTPRIGPVLYFKMSPSMTASRIAEQIKTAMREAGTLKE